MEIENKILVGVGAVLVVLLGVFLFGSEPGQNQIPDFPEETDVLRVGTTLDMVVDDPARMSHIMSKAVYHNTADTLVRYTENGSIVPNLAEDWTVEDGNVYTFRIRDGVRFHDGTRLTPEDVKFSIERMKELKRPKLSILENVEDVETVGESSVRITLENRSAAFIRQLATPWTSIISSESYSASEVEADLPVTSGPYRIEKTAERYIQLEKTQDYWRNISGSDVILVEHVPQQANLKRRIYRDQIDISFRSFDSYRKEEDLTEGIMLKNTSDTRFVVMNTDKGIFSDRSVRKALAYSIDRDELMEDTFQSGGYPIESLLPADMKEYVPAFEQYRDTDRAEELLKEAGYSEDNKLKFNIYFTDYGLHEERIAEEIKSQFERNNLTEVETEQLEWGRMAERIYKGSIGIHLLGWFPDYYDPQNYLEPLLSSNMSKYTGSHYNSSKMDRLLEKGETTTDKEERRSTFRKIQEKAAEDVPYIPLFQPKRIVQVSESIQKDTVSYSPLGIPDWYSIRKKE